MPLSCIRPALVFAEFAADPLLAIALLLVLFEMASCWDASWCWLSTVGVAVLDVPLAVFTTEASDLACCLLTEASLFWASMAFLLVGDEEADEELDASESFTVENLRFLGRPFWLLAEFEAASPAASSSLRPVVASSVLDVDVDVAVGVEVDWDCCEVRETVFSDA